MIGFLTVCSDLCQSVRCILNTKGEKKKRIPMQNKKLTYFFTKTFPESSVATGGVKLKNAVSEHSSNRIFLESGHESPNEGGVTSPIEVRDVIIVGC